MKQEHSLRKLYRLFSPSEKRLLKFAWLMIFISAMYSVVGIASIMPFLAVLSKPAVIHSNEYLKWAYDYFSFESNRSFLIALGSTMLGVIITGNLLNAFTRWIEIRFTTHIGIGLQNRLMQRYLQKPYAFFLSRNTSNMLKTLLGETGQAINGVLVPFIFALNQALLALMILVLLLIADPILAVLAISIMGGMFVGIFRLIKKRLRRFGVIRVKANGRRYKTGQEALSGIKDLKVRGKEKVYLHYFSQAVKDMMRIQKKIRIYQMVPPILMEIVVMTGIMGLVLYLLVREGSFIEIIPTIALFAYAAFRLKPALNNVFQKVSQIKTSLPALENVLEEIESEEGLEEELVSHNEVLHLKKELSVSALTYYYPNAERPALNKVSFSFPVNSSIAFVGPTGSGKTTLVDVLLGLLKVNQGQINVDDTPLGGTQWRKWQNNIGYIPQHIYLTDDTIAANIAFGVKGSQIDHERIEEVAKAAHLGAFVGSLPENFNTVIGERGVRLSGGQRQRIGIARALYHNPDILVMDEATSALDNITEKGVMQAINELAGKKTIIMIAHRLSTVENCDIIFMMDQGKIRDQGSYQELLERNAHFQEMVNAPKA